MESRMTDRINYEMPMNEELLRKKRAELRKRRIIKQKRKQRRKFLYLLVIIIFVIGLLVLIPRIEQNTTKNEIQIITPTVDDMFALPYIFQEYIDIPYFKSEYMERYTAYKDAHGELSAEEIITHCNMGIDVEFYSRESVEIENPSAIDVLVNKVYALPSDYEPNDLAIVESGRNTLMRAEAATAFNKLKEACKNEGFNIVAVSGYRTTAYQQTVYNNKVASSGVEYANKYVSRPGHSEHSTGLAVDVGINGTDYNAISKSEYYPTFYSMLEEYGFIVRYPNEKQDLTGYNYEAWHIRYLGLDVAKAVMESGLTYDEYVARKY